jgi:hypothetical protein
MRTPPGPSLCSGPSSQCTPHQPAVRARLGGWQCASRIVLSKNKTGRRTMRQTPPRVQHRVLRASSEPLWTPSSRRYRKHSAVRSTCFLSLVNIGSQFIAHGPSRRRGDTTIEMYAFNIYEVYSLYTTYIRLIWDPYTVAITRCTSQSVPAVWSLVNNSGAPNSHHSNVR